MRWLVILNPYARRWNGQRRIEELRATLAARQIDHSLRATEAAGDARTFAANADPAEFDAVIAAGGDGTVNEVVNGLLTAAGDGAPVPLGVVPIGTGNDFATMIGVPRGVAEAVDALATRPVRPVDAARVRFWCACDDSNAPPLEHEHFFVNNCAVAMEPLVTIENTRIKRVSGNLRYLLSVGRALTKLQAWRMCIGWDDGGYDGPVYLFSVCNTQRTGGLFRMAPDARFDDGLFDFVLVKPVSKWRVVRLAMKILRGTHTRESDVSYLRASEIELTSTPGTPIHADGEVLTDSAVRVRFEMLAGKLPVLGSRTAI